MKDILVTKEKKKNNSNEKIITSPIPKPSVKVNPVVQRIHPNSIFSFQVWDKENDDATILLIGENIQDSVVEVCFLNPFWKDKYVVARSKFTRYREKEYYIPCLKNY